MDERKKLKFILYTFIALMVIGTIGYMILLKINLVDAIYMTVITISTVGFGELGDMHESGRLFSIFMIFSGVGIVGYAFTNLVVLLVEGKIVDLWKGKKMNYNISQLKGHYIICGSTELAEVVIAKFVKEGLDFVVITPNRDDLDEYSHHNILVIEGCSTEEEILEKAGVEKAKGLICTMDSEVDNIVTVLTARNLNDKIYIISNSVSKSDAEKLMKVGANKTLSSVEISGKRMAALMIKPNIISFLDVFTRVGDVELDLEEVTVMKGSYLENKTLSEAEIQDKTGLLVLAIKKAQDENPIFNPPMDYSFEIDDVLIVLGREDQVEKLRHLGDEISD